MQKWTASAISNMCQSVYSVKVWVLLTANFYLEIPEHLIPRLLSVCVWRTFYSIKSSHDAPSDQDFWWYFCSQVHLNSYIRIKTVKIISSVMNIQTIIKPFLFQRNPTFNNSKDSWKRNTKSTVWIMLKTICWEILIILLNNSRGPPPAFSRSLSDCKVQHHNCFDIIVTC